MSNEYAPDITRTEAVVINQDSGSSPEHLLTVFHRAQEIMHERADYLEGESTLREHGLLEKLTVLTKNTFTKKLEFATWMTESDWEMLACMYAYDEITAKHCVETLRIAENRIKNPFRGETLAHVIETEIGSLEHFYRACLFHDIGKCCLPYSLLTNRKDDYELTELLVGLYEQNGADAIIQRIEQDIGVLYNGTTPANLRTFVQNNNLHMMRYLPVTAVASQTAIEEVRGRFPDIQDTWTLAEVINKHEEASGKVLREKGYAVAATIAESHHSTGTTPYPLARDTLNLSVKLEEILALADIEEAFLAERPYKKGLPMVEALYGLIGEAKYKGINEDLTRAWVKHDSELVDQDTLTEEERRMWQVVLDFIA